MPVSSRTGKKHHRDSDAGSGPLNRGARRRGGSASIGSKAAESRDGVAAREVSARFCARRNYNVPSTRAVGTTQPTLSLQFIGIVMMPRRAKPTAQLDRTIAVSERDAIDGEERDTDLNAQQPGNRRIGGNGPHLLLRFQHSHTEMRLE